MKNRCEAPRGRPVATLTLERKSAASAANVNTATGTTGIADQRCCDQQNTDAAPSGRRFPWGVSPGKARGEVSRPPRRPPAPRIPARCRGQLSHPRTHGALAGARRTSTPRASFPAAPMKSAHARDLRFRMGWRVLYQSTRAKPIARRWCSCAMRGACSVQLHAGIWARGQRRAPAIAAPAAMDRPGPAPPRAASG